MINQEFSEGISETLDILNHVDEYYRNKIPNKFKDFLEKNKSLNYVPHLDYTKELNKLDIKEKTKDILAAIYLSYWCSKEEKDEYLKLLNENQRKKEDAMREKYNPDNLFKKANKDTKCIEENTTNEVSLVNHNESIMKEFRNKILSFFNK